jgi:hypothetical protein
MNPVSRILIGLGVLLVAIGLVWAALSGSGLSKYLPFGRLPGDIVVERENFKFYFPLATSIVVSVLISLLLYLLSRFR